MIAVADNRLAVELRNDPEELFQYHQYVAEICSNKTWCKFRNKLQSQFGKEDLGQICYTALHLASVSYRPEMGRFESYAYRCCKNAMLDVLKCHKGREMSNFEFLENMPNNSRNMPNGVVMAAVLSLPRDMCTVVLMTYGLAGYREYTQKEIAEKTGWTRSRIQSLASAARSSLAVILST